MLSNSDNDQADVQLYFAKPFLNFIDDTII